MNTFTVDDMHHGHRHTPPRPAWLVTGIVAAMVAFAGAGPAAAQFGGPRLKIADVRIGLPPGRFVGEREDTSLASHVFKKNTWAPVYITLEVLKETKENAWVILETPDADDLRTKIVFPLGSFADANPGTVVRSVELPVVPMVRPADGSGELTVGVYSDPQGYRSLADSTRLPLYRARGSNTYVVLALGSKLPGFDLPGEEGKSDGSPTGAVNRGALRNGRVETAAISNVREMPDQWFGYQAVDLVVLATGSAPNDFLQDLFDPQRSAQFAAKREALLEWVRRGGRLVVSVGSNAGALSGYEAFQAILPARLAAGEPARGLAELQLGWDGFGRRGSGTLRPKGESFAVSRFAPDPNKPPRQLIPKTGETGPRPRADVPVVLQAPFGLGRITAVAFDLDRSPFLDFAERTAFWDWLVRVAGADRPSTGSGQPEEVTWGVYDSEDQFVTGLREHVDNFEGVPVISFGWVALFIALYTLLIGPVEYFFLKRVVGRLELTWVTFPLIVFTVSAAAYFTAYAIKGNDLKVNKVDLVDVDPASGRVYGRSWFTIFSPRIDNYTIGIEPRDGWVANRPGDPSTPRTLVDWMAGSRGGGGNLVSRGYTYHTDEDTARVVADGLVGVPIQVWSTKAFEANWSGYTDPAAPLIESRLYHPPGDPKALAGSFVNNIPVKELKDAVLIYGGVPYELEQGTLVPGEYRPVLDKRDTNWFDRAAPAAVRPGTGFQVVSVGFNTLFGALFHERLVSRDQPLTNASLRGLDQSWRVSDRPEHLYLDQAILIARVDASGLSEPMMTDPDGASPTRLWYKALPGGGQPWPPVPGTLRQETYIRAFLPVAPRPGMQRDK